MDNSQEKQYAYLKSEMTRAEKSLAIMKHHFGAENVEEYDTSKVGQTFITSSPKRKEKTKDSEK